jgi:hypothetical protein
MYPLVRSHQFRTNVYTHVDFSEQRFSKGVDLQMFDLTFHNLKTADKETVRVFFNSTRGNFDTTWTLTYTDTDGTPQTYTNLQFVGNTLDATQTEPGVWQIKLKVRQTRQ